MLKEACPHHRSLSTFVSMILNSQKCKNKLQILRTKNYCFINKNRVFSAKIMDRLATNQNLRKMTKIYQEITKVNCSIKRANRAFSKLQKNPMITHKSYFKI